MACAGSPSSTPDGDVAQLHRLGQVVAAAMNDKDADALMGPYAKGRVLFVFDVVAPPSAHVGWDEYHDAFTHMFAAIDGPLSFTMSDLEIEVSGDVAYGRSLQRVEGVHRKDGKAFDYTVRVTDVYRKIAGEWRIVQEHVSLPIDRDTFTPVLHTSLAGSVRPASKRA